MPLVLITLMLVAVVGTALWITGNVIRYRRDVYQHWYSVGYRDASTGSYWYDIHKQQSMYVVKAYIAGYNEGKPSSWN